MKIVSEIQQDTQEWLDFKRTRIGGSGAKSTAVPLARGVDRTPAGFWDLVANRLTKPLTDENPTDRGHRLETDAIDELKTIVGLDFDAKPCVWQSDEDEDLILSSDGCQPGEKITYDAEVKSFTKLSKHFKLLYTLRNYTGSLFDLLQIDYSSDYRYQILHGFIVNPDLKVRYFVSYCPEAIYQEHRLVVLPIYRGEVEEEINDLKEYEQKTLARVRSIVSELVGDNF